jgi:diguanylate cyclase (GGDEF)-like protein/PAS domain S-box-containing protein
MMTNAPDLPFPFAEPPAPIDPAFDMMALLDGSGRLLRVNAASEDILGYAPHEMVGRHIHEFIHPDDHEARAAIAAAVREGAPCRERELRYLHRDGHEIWLAMSGTWSASAGVMVTSGRDVTIHRRARDELRRSRARLDAVLESIGDAFFAMDSDWRIIYANRRAAEFVHADIGASIGKPLLDVAPALKGTAILEHYRAAMDSGRSSVVESWWPPTSTWYEVRIYPTPDGLSVYFHDNTAQRAAAHALRESEQRFRELIEMTPSGYVRAGMDGVILDVNPSLCRLGGMARDALLGRTLSDLFERAPWEGLEADADGLATVRGVEAVLLRGDGGRTHVLFNGSLRRAADGRIAHATGLMTDITARKQVETRLHQLATHDTLTGLPNRALLHERVQGMLDACAQDGEVAVMFLDLDRFKDVNDSFGHEFGDVLLCAVAERLRGALGPGAVIARLGGDEFVVARRCARDGADGALCTARRLLDALTAPVRIGAQDVIIGASIGIAMYPRDAGTRELLFQAADTAMYRAKGAGRNRHRFFERGMTVATQARMTLELALRPALASAQFELHYQPRIDLRTMDVVGMEALLRWNHPELGRVPPAEFIGIAEETGLIVAIGRWALGEACRRTQELIERHGRAVRVSVNVSARQLAQPGFVDDVRAELAASGLAPHCLELELTESALIDDMDRTAAMLGELKGLGVKLAVDDFGTGYSSLAYLRRFPVDILKLDRSFVLQDDGRISAFDFVKAFVDMAHALRLSVVAEGVETVEVLDFLRAADCDEAQGYLMARPMPLDQLHALFAARPPRSAD